MIAVGWLILALFVLGLIGFLALCAWAIVKIWREPVED